MSIILYKVFHSKGQDDVEFPCGLNDYGLTESILDEVWTQVQESDTCPLRWSLQDTPNVDFYQDLSSFFKRWSKSKQATKMGIGRFFIAIDKNLQGYRADNAYRFIQRVSASNLPRDTQVNYRVQEREM